MFGYNVVVQISVKTTAQFLHYYTQWGKKISQLLFPSFPLKNNYDEKFSHDYFFKALSSILMRRATLRLQLYYWPWNHILCSVYIVLWQNYGIMMMRSHSLMLKLFSNGHIHLFLPNIAVWISSTNRSRPCETPFTLIIALQKITSLAASLLNEISGKRHFRYGLISDLKTAILDFTSTRSVWSRWIYSWRAKHSKKSEPSTSFVLTVFVFVQSNMYH